MIKDSKMNQSLCLFQILQVETVSRLEPKSNQNSAESSTILDNEMSEMDTRPEKNKSPFNALEKSSSNAPILQKYGKYRFKNYLQSFFLIPCEQ